MQHNPRKRFGQNFLTNKGVIASIVAAIAPNENENIIEIGPGMGALTDHLIKCSANVIAVEIDNDLSAHLQQKYNKCKNFKLENIDILKYQFPNQSNFKIVGNLPYNISTPILFYLFNYIEQINSMFFMLQKEVAKRMTAVPNSKTYGKLSIMTQFYCQTEIILNVAPEAFNPKPKVDSCIIKLTPKKLSEDELGLKDLLYKITTFAFNQRRKTISNSLKTVISSEELLKLDISPSLRAENLNLSQYLSICKHIKDN